MKRANSLEVDLSTGQVLEATIEIDELEWYLPLESPLFKIAISDALINQEGFTLSTDSSLTAVSIDQETRYALTPIDDFQLGCANFFNIER